MANSVVRLRIDSQEFDANIKRAGQALTDYFNKVKEGGGTLMHLDEGVMDAVEAMGKLGTQADTARGSLEEITQTLVDLTTSYRGFTSEEKSSPLGVAMSKSLQQLTERAANVRDAMSDVKASISNAASDTRMFDKLAGGAALAVNGFQALQGASKLLGVEMDDNVEVIAKLQAAMAITNSLTQAQTALQKQSALMQGVMAVQAKAAAAAIALESSNTKAATVAQAAFNAVAKANPYVLLASAVAAVGTALIGFSNSAKKATNSIKEETAAMRQAQQMDDIWKNSLSSTFSSLMSKYDELKRQWSSLKDEHQKTEWIKNNQRELQNLGGAVTDVTSAEEFFNNNTDAVVQSFVRRAQAAARVAQLTELYRKQIELIDKKQRTEQAISEDAARSGRSAQAGEEIKDSSYWNSRYGSVDKEGKWRFSEQGAKLYSGTDTSTADAVVKVDVELQANQNEIDKIKGQITNEFSDVVIPTGGGKGGGRGGKNEPPKEEQPIEELLSQGAKEVKSKAFDFSDAAMGATQSMKELQRLLKWYNDALLNATNTQEYNAALAGIKQTQTKIDAQPTALEKGITIEQAVDLKFSENYESQLQEMKSKLEADFKENPIEVEVSGGQKLKKLAIANEEAWSGVADALQSAGSALGAFEDPSLNIAATIATSLANVALAFSQALKGTATPWDFIAGVAGGVAAMASAVAAIKSVASEAEGFAEGGIIGGNTYSGDQIPIMANAGELILNRAQQATLAEQLSPQSGGGGTTHAIINSDNIKIALRNGAEKRGKTLRDYLEI